MAFWPQRWRPSLLTRRRVGPAAHSLADCARVARPAPSCHRPDRFRTGARMIEDLERARLTQNLRKVAQGDRGALREVYQRTSAKLFGVCLRILNDRQEAEDVLQDVYLTVWRRAGS